MSRRLLAALTVSALALGVGPAFAHEGRAVEPHDLWSAWSFDLGTAVPLVLAAVLFAIGAHRLARRAAEHGQPARRRRALGFVVGWATLAIALLSPIHAVSEALFSMHMVQHELLMVVAAPVLVLSRPLVPMLWAMPAPWRRRVGRAMNARSLRRGWTVLSSIPIAWALHAVAIWTWHLPALYERTLSSSLAHAAQHASFFATALVFWWSVARGRRARTAGVLALFTTAVHTAALGALIALAPTPWYPRYGETSSAWGLTALEDQQLAGLIMWMPATIAYAAGALWLAASWLREPRDRAALARASLWSIAVMFLILTGAACAKDQRRPERKESGSFVYVSNEDSNDISVIDTRTDSVVATIPVGTRPRGILVSPDGRTVYVALSGSPKAPPGVDESTLPPPDKAADGIAAIDVATHRVRATYPAGSDPEAFAIAPDGRTIYISNEDAGLASALDVESGQVVYTLRVGDEPEGVGITRDGKYVYVTGEMTNDVAVVDVAARRIVKRMRMGKRPRGIAFTPDGRKAYVSEELGGAVAVVDVSRHEVVDSIRVPGDGAKPMGLAVTPDGMQLLVTTGRGGALAFVDVKRDSVIASIDVGTRPWGLAISADGTKAYTANGPSNDVAVIDVATRRVLKRISVGRLPWGAAASPR